MINITIHISGAAEEIAKFTRLGDKLKDFSSALNSAGKELKTYYSQTVFGSEGGAVGQRWQALSPAYKRWKGKHYPNKGILIASGTMQRSFRAVATHNKLVIDNTTPYFKYHQTGTGYGGANIVGIARGKSMFHIGGIGPGRGNNLPARPMLVYNAEAAGILGGAIAEDIKTKLEAIR